ncbi:DUF5615 family PIN-like protein [Candidatus Poriferisocius sp.]|uniref:DUF5615 family PIN-like protein n=1 Tax=Candidatus Poriferisocius sp. TaxID=3101276 RepID=UPI003B5A20D3
MSPQPTKPRLRPKIRLLFDENLPWRVAAALETLNFHSTYVGDKNHPDVPTRGSSDEEVLRYTEGVNRTIVTSNYDMILLCTERKQSVIWIDARGRDFRFEELVLLVFKNISDWNDRLKQASLPICLQAMRTKTVTLTMEEAAQRAHSRMLRSSAKKRRNKSHTPLGPLLSPEDESK